MDQKQCKGPDLQLQAPSAEWQGSCASEDFRLDVSGNINDLNVIDLAPS